MSLINTTITDNSYHLLCRRWRWCIYGRVLQLQQRPNVQLFLITSLLRRDTIVCCLHIFMLRPYLFICSRMVSEYEYFAAVVCCFFYTFALRIGNYKWNVEEFAAQRAFLTNCAADWNTNHSPWNKSQAIYCSKSRKMADAMGLQRVDANADDLVLILNEKQ